MRLERRFFPGRSDVSRNPRLTTYLGVQLQCSLVTGDQVSIWTLIISQATPLYTIEDLRLPHSPWILSVNSCP